MTMRLGERLTLYYVSSIAVILAGFSIALYAVAAKHLYRQVDERIESASTRWWPRPKSAPKASRGNPRNEA